jgi:hypothetical protein
VNFSLERGKFKPAIIIKMWSEVDGKTTDLSKIPNH